MVSGVTLRINHRQSTIHASFNPSEIVCNVSRISCLNSSMISRSVLSLEANRSITSNHLTLMFCPFEGAEQMIFDCHLPTKMH
jgi:hypothetical protein